MNIEDTLTEIIKIMNKNESTEKAKLLVTEIFKNIDEDNLMEIFSSLLVNILKNTGADELIEKFNSSKEITNYPFKVIEYPKDKKVVPDIKTEDLKILEEDETITNIEKIVNINIKKREHHFITGSSNIGKEIIDFKILFPTVQSKEFFSKYRDKSIICKANITYNESFDCYCMGNLEIYEISSPLEKWKELMVGKTLLERINILLNVLGLNPENLLHHEKIIFIERLIPLVVKKILLLDISKKELGKTYSYTSLGFYPYTLLVTRANAFVDGRNKKDGDFFLENIAFIIDELTKIEDPELITALQVYMNGDKDKGRIQVRGNDIRETDISTIILGNVKNKIDLLDLFSNNKNLFDDTVIMKSPDGEAFVSRITALLNSWGCRTFSPSMKSNIDSNFYNLELLKVVIPILRKKEFDIKSFYEMMGISCENPSIRSSESVEKNLEGFIKLFYPEFIDGVNTNEFLRHKNEFLFLFDRACEMRKVVDNQLKIINPNDNKEMTLPCLTSSLREIMFNIEEKHFFTPHRIFIFKVNGDIEKIPLDTIGIEMNKREAELLDSNSQYIANSQYNNQYILDKNYFLTHTSNWYIKYNNIIKVEINYNYLVGEYEYLELDETGIEFINNHSFWHFVS